MNKAFIEALIEGVPLGKRKLLDKVYYNCFSGQDVVNFLVQNGIALDRNQATKIGTSMINQKIFVHITNDHGFKDSPQIYYKYTPQYETMAAHKINKSNSLEDTSTNQGETTAFVRTNSLDEAPRKTRLILGRNRSTTIADTPLRRVNSDLMARTEPPAPRMGHTAVVYDRKLWVYGGKGERSNLNDLAVYSFTKNVWLSPLSATGSTPGQRRSHHATVYNNKMYIYGGYFGYNLVTDMFEYDFEKRVWSQVKYKTETVPTGTYLASSVVYKDSWYFFGGMDVSGASTNDLWRFQLESQTWEKCKTIGIAPGKRWGHSAVLYKDQMIIWGGTTTEGALLNEMFSLSFDDLQWNRIINAPGNKPPMGRYGHVTCVVDNGMYVFGGIKTEGNTAEFFMFNIDTKLWTKVEAQSACKPSSRSYMTINYVNSGLYIFGGKSNIGFKNSFFKYSINLNVWKIIWSMFELEGRVGVEDVPIVPVDPVDPELICPLHGGIFVDPVLLLCQHVFCTSCIIKKDVCPSCCEKVNFEDVSNADEMNERIKNIIIHCKYGSKYENGRWIPDERGCTEKIVIKEREIHEMSCKFNICVCPNSKNCVIKNRHELDKHIAEECSFHKCPNQEFSCLYVGTLKSMKSHLENECVPEKLKPVLVAMKEKIEKQQKEIESLKMQLKEGNTSENVVE